MKKYLKLAGQEYDEDENGKFLKVETYYSKGGMNYFTYKEEKRGYYASAGVVDVENRHGFRSEGCTLFKGMKLMLKEVGRKSAKAEAEAEILAQGDNVKNLCNAVAQNNDVTIIW